MLVFDQIKKGDPHLRVVSVIVALGMAVLLVGLWYIQVVTAQRYRADLQEQSMRIVRVPAIRGKILDRNGFALADNRPTYNVNVYLEEFRRLFRYDYTNRVLREYRRAHPGPRPTGREDALLQKQARCRVVSNLLWQVSSLVQQPQALDEKQFTNHYENLRSLPFPLMRDLSVRQVALFSEKSRPSPNLALEVQPIRTYPWTNTAAQLVGHLVRDNRPADEEDISFQFRLPDYIGAMGVERAFDQYLRGRPGVKSVLVNNLQYRQAEQILTPPEPGQNVVLTIDLPIQRAAEKALRNALPDPRGAAVVMDCRTGDVLALASVPAFDPNLFVSRISNEEWAKASDAEELPQLNRATSGTYPPGSIFKIIVSLAGLEAGVIHPEESFETKGYYQIGGKGHPWKCTAPAGHYDFNKAFYKSCNCYFIDHGLQIGFEKVAEMGRRFGLGVRTGFNSRVGEATGYFPDASEKIKKDGTRWMSGDTANLCIGQGELKVSPLQMAVMTAAIANGGKILEPRIIDRIEPPDPSGVGDVIKFPSAQVRAQLSINPQHMELVRNAMLLDVTHRENGRLDGTGQRAAVEGMNICGKTGTAQLMEGHKLKEHIVWFVSFAPLEAPRYVVVVMAELDAAFAGSGATVCAPIAHDIYEAILKREQPAPLKAQHSIALN